MELLEGAHIKIVAEPGSSQGILQTLAKARKGGRVFVVDYVRARFMAGASGPHATSPTPPAPADAASYHAQPLPNGLSGNVARGHALYLVNCVECHGVAGDGNGPRAYFIFPKPRNFRDPATQNILNRPRLYMGIADGVLGKEMPAWSKVFSDQDIADVAEFVYREFITATPAN